MSICYIIGAGELPLLYIKDNKQSLIIAADGGLEHLGEQKPNIIVGDFDSLGYIPDSPNTVILPTEKDLTDMKYATKIGIEKGFKTFILYGGTGGRVDHTFANISLICFLAEKGYRGYLIGDGMIITAIKNTSIKLPKKKEGTVSVFTAGESAFGVTIKGLKYTLSNYTLKFSQALGVSNSYIGQDAEISVKDGTLIVMFQEDVKNFIDNL